MCVILAHCTYLIGRRNAATPVARPGPRLACLMIMCTHGGVLQFVEHSAIVASRIDWVVRTAVESLFAQPRLSLRDLNNLETRLSPWRNLRNIRDRWSLRHK